MWSRIFVGDERSMLEARNRARDVVLRSNLFRPLRYYWRQSIGLYQISVLGCSPTHHTRQRPSSPSKFTDLAGQPHADLDSTLDRSRGRRSAERVRLSSLVRSKGPGGSDLACIPADRRDAVATEGRRGERHRDTDRSVCLSCLRSLPPPLLKEDTAVWRSGVSIICPPTKYTR